LYLTYSKVYTNEYLMSSDTVDKPQTKKDVNHLNIGTSFFKNLLIFIEW